MDEVITKYTYQNREISWLAFNHRVLQEAMSENVPLYERIKFVAIFHSNLDEFFRVRVAAIKSMRNLKTKHKKKLSFDPDELLTQIFDIIDEHYAILDKYFYKQIIPELQTHNVNLLEHNQVSPEQRAFLYDYARNNILPFIQPSLLEKNKILAFLKNRALYLAIELSAKDGSQNGSKKYAYVEIPTERVERFIDLPDKSGVHNYILVDDAVRALLPEIFSGYNVDGAYSFMLNRDAELYIDDEFSGNLVEKIRKSLAKRDVGVPIGFIYDLNMPKDMLSYITEAFVIEKEAFIKGSKYLKMSDFMDFPNPLNPALKNQNWPPLDHRHFRKYDSMFDAIKARDRLLNFPYQKFDYVVKLIDAAANDERVSSIGITLYRTSKKSQVAKALITAANNGKEVTAFVEVKARFDEKSNLKWAKRMEDAGVHVIYSLPVLKVHTKLLLITRLENEEQKQYAYIGTGNFNSNTARIYGDHALITADANITHEAQKIFDMLAGKMDDYEFKHLLVAPNHMRKHFLAFIDFEIAEAKAGRKAHIVIKQNAIEDREMIEKLYEASNAGVTIDMIVRGICCLVPGVPGQSENINVISIVDRYLEHARIYKFHHGGEELLYIASADWMKRNLIRRIEVAAPIRNEKVKAQIQTILDLQWADNVKARIISDKVDNKFVVNSDEKIQSQKAIYQYFESLLS